MYFFSLYFFLGLSSVGAFRVRKRFQPFALNGMDQMISADQGWFEIFSWVLLISQSTYILKLYIDIKKSYRTKKGPNDESETSPEQWESNVNDFWNNMG